MFRVSLFHRIMITLSVILLAFANPGYGVRAESKLLQHGDFPECENLDNDSTFSCALDVAKTTQSPDACALLTSDHGSYQDCVILLAEYHGNSSYCTYLADFRNQWVAECVIRSATTVKDCAEMIPNSKYHKFCESQLAAKIKGGATCYSPGQDRDHCIITHARFQGDPNGCDFIGPPEFDSYYKRSECLVGARSNVITGAAIGILVAPLLVLLVIMSAVVLKFARNYKPWLVGLLFGFIVGYLTNIPSLVLGAYFGHPLGVVLYILLLPFLSIHQVYGSLVQPLLEISGLIELAFVYRTMPVLISWHLALLFGILTAPIAALMVMIFKKFARLTGPK